MNELNAMMGNALLKIMNTSYPKSHYQKANDLQNSLKVMSYQNKKFLFNMSQIFGRNKQDYLNELNYERNRSERENEECFLRNDYENRR